MLSTKYNMFARVCVCVCATVMEFIAHMVCSGYSPENACRQQNGILTTLFVVFFLLKLHKKMKDDDSGEKSEYNFLPFFFFESA